MKMTKLVLVVAFLVVLAAGAVVGMAVDRQLWPTAAPVPVSPSLATRPSSPRFPRLTPQQQAQMDEIWRPVVRLRESRFQERHDLNLKLTQDIQALLSPEQNKAYDAIQARYRADVQKLEGTLQDAIHQAEQQTRPILTKEQLDQYDKFREWQRRNGRNGPGRGGPGRGGPGRGGRDRMRPTTGPTTAPASPLTNAS
jgi:hypothetical protein